MAKPRIPNQRKQYIKLNERLARYVLAVQSIYDEYNRRAAALALQTGYDGVGKFSFDDFPELRMQVEKLQSDFVSDLGALIIRGTSEEWRRSNILQDMLADKVIKAYTGEKNREQFTHYYQTNSAQLRAFQQRKDRGMNLSAKLWNQSETYKRELEETISVAVEQGTDAVTLSKRLSRYLADFDTLQKDYTEKFGEAATAHDCEYRSIRLARSEINMAYRTAEQARWQQFDFVVGYEIKLSGSHPKDDICDRLQGKYPKDFVWTGWHPNDLCYCIPLLKTEEEFFATGDEEDLSQEEMAKRMIMSNDERKAVYEGDTRFVSHLSGFRINRSLNETHGDLSKLTSEQRRAVEVHDEVIGKNVAPQELHVFRRNTAQFLNAVGDLHVGSEYQTYGYTAASLYESKNVSPLWSDGSVVNIKIPKGAHCLVTENYNESEVMLPRNSRFRVLRVYEVDGIKTFDVELVTGLTDIKENFVNEVTDVPAEFKKWCIENKDKIHDAEKRRTLPYFLRDNKSYYKR